MNPASAHPRSLPPCLAANGLAFSIPSRGPQQSAQLKPREAVSREFGQFESAKVRAGALSLMAGPLLGSLRNVNPARTIHLARFVSPDSASRRGVEPLAPPKAHGFPSQPISTQAARG